MNLRILILSSLLLLTGLDVTAQRASKQKKIKNTIDPNSPAGVALTETAEGDKYFDSKGLELSYALEHYLNAYKTDSRNPVLNYKIGVCYLNTINKVRSISYLEKANKLKPNVSRDIHYLLGLAYHLNLQWDDAIREYENYRLSLSPDLLKALAPEIDKKIQECKTGKILVRHPVSVTIENMGPTVNSIYPEFAPFLTADESTMYFTARKDNTTGGDMDDKDYQFYEDVYVSVKENGQWTTPKNLGEPVNTEYHDGVAGLSADGHRLFIYRGDLHGGDVLESRLQGFEWTKPVSLGKNINTKYHEPSVCLSSDQKTLYFVSDKPEDSYGGSDIYLSHLDEKGNWGPPVNLGPVINTSYDEDGAFMYADDKTLFFSSKGHETMGGYDIFSSVYSDSLKAWSKPVNLGYPINTPDDDVFFVISASGKHGYYASVKNDGVGEKDLYMVSFLGKGKSTPDSATCVIINNHITILKGVVSDAVTHIPLQAFIEIVDNSKGITIASFESNGKTGKYLVSLPDGRNYGIYVSAPGYLFHSENFDIPQSQEYQEIVKNIELDRVEEGKKIILKNIFYDFDKATLRTESVFELGRIISLMAQFPTLKIEISSHTDSMGSVEYNRVLSEARAKSVVDYMILKGVDIKRMNYKGYGKSEPVASNETTEGRQLNRRTEFRILSK